MLAAGTNSWPQDGKTTSPGVAGHLATEFDRIFLSNLISEVKNVLFLKRVTTLKVGNHTNTGLNLLI